MKKKDVILCAGILSITMLGGCGGTTLEESNTAITQEAEETAETQEATETKEATEVIAEAIVTQEAADFTEEFSAIMTEIYELSGDSDAEEIAEKFKNYAFTNGAPSSSMNFQYMAENWFQMMEEKEGKDIRPEFNQRFEVVTSTAKKMDETLEYDVLYSNVVNGIIAAIEE